MDDGLIGFVIGFIVGALLGAIVCGAIVDNVHKTAAVERGFATRTVSANGSTEWAWNEKEAK